jgi:protein-disulfide isomerase
MSRRSINYVVAWVLAIAVGAWVVLDVTPFRGLGGRGAVAEELSPGELDQRIRDYILQHPEVIVEALRRLEAQREAAAANETQSVITSRREEIFNDPATPVGGNPDGDVSIVEFFDYNCPYCRKNAPTLAELERTDPNLRFVYKEWPILGPGSEFAARAALASMRQGKYVAYHKAMMAVSGRITEDKVLEVAGTVGIDVEQLKRDIKDAAINEAIERNRDLARALGVTGTPAFLVNEQFLPGLQEMPVLQSVIRLTREGKTVPNQGATSQ